jgi:hypothetical protein
MILSRWKKVAGIVEFNWFLDNQAYSSMLRLPMLSGMEPTNLLPWR